MVEQSFTEKMFPRRKLLIGCGSVTAATLLAYAGDFFTRHRVMSVSPTSNTTVFQPPLDMDASPNLSTVASEEEVNFFIYFLKQELRPDNDPSFWRYLDSVSIADLIKEGQIKYGVSEDTMNPYSSKRPPQRVQRMNMGLLAPPNRIQGNPYTIFNFTTIKDLHGKVVSCDLSFEVDKQGIFGYNRYLIKNFSLQERMWLANQVLRYPPTKMPIMPNSIPMIEGTSEYSEWFYRYQVSSSGYFYIKREAK